MSTISVFRKLALLGATATALATSGCIIDTTSSTCTPAAIDITWVVAPAQGAAPISCAQAGAAFVDFVVDGVSYESPCTDGGATVTVSGGANHTISSFVLLDGNGNNLSATQGTMTTFLGCGDVWSLTGANGIEFDLS